MKNHMLILPCLAALMFAGCAMSRSAKSAPASDGAFMLPQESGRSIVRTARLTIEVASTDKAVESVSSIVKTQKGFVENRSSHDDDKRAFFTLRVPPENFEAAVAGLEQLGNVESRSIDARDVTAELVDIDARLQNLKALRDRLKTLLEKAEAVSDVLAVEKEFTRVQSDIDSIEARMKTLQGKVDMATISLTLNRKPILGPVGFAFKWLFWGVGKLFVIRD